ncbi:MAG: aminoacyl-tRNA hydrolase [Gammaproteobacteria bacterium]|nr:aminoacyl-tRNA hydrolase [Gammaproteobacteria bacterium]
MIPELVVGLGNPGPKYTETRHNAGFWFVERLAETAGSGFRRNARFHGEVAVLHLPGRDCRVLKPATFMNDSGRAVRAALDFYGLSPDQLIVVHDEIDLPPGAARLKRGGGHGGHNGLRDVIECLGDGGFLRLRLGVGHPGSAADVVDYVLHRPGVAERELIYAAMARALEVMPMVLQGKTQKAMKELHTKE